MEPKKSLEGTDHAKPIHKCARNNRETLRNRILQVRLCRTFAGVGMEGRESPKIGRGASKSRPCERLRPRFGRGSLPRPSEVLRRRAQSQFWLLEVNTKPKKSARSPRSQFEAKLPPNQYILSLRWPQNPNRPQFTSPSVPHLCRSR